MKAKTVRLLVFVAIFLSITNLIGDVANQRNYGAIDLRNRVVGARSFSAGFDPYHFKWNPDLPKSLLDPIDYVSFSFRNVSRLSVTPTSQLLFFPLLTSSNYVHIKMVWMLLSTLVFWTTAYLAYEKIAKTEDQKILTLLVFIFFSISYFWRLHLERGQLYVFFPLLLVLSYIFAKSTNEFQNYISGLMLGLLVLLRPTYIVILGILFLAKKYRLFVASLVSMFFLALVTAIVFSPGVWTNYFNAVFYRIDSQTPVSEKDTKLRKQHTKNIEGLTYVGKPKPIPAVDKSLKNYLDSTFNLDINDKHLIYLGVAVGAFFMLAMLKTSSKLPLEQLFFGSLVLHSFLEICVPIPMYSYTDIAMFAPLAFALTRIRSTKSFLLSVWGVILLLSLLFGTSLVNSTSFLSSSDRLTIGAYLQLAFVAGMFFKDSSFFGIHLHTTTKRESNN
jgi:hypothetical protein